MRRRLAACLLFWGMAVPLMGWNAEGHMVIAQIAYNHLDPAVKQVCDQLIAVTLPNRSTGTSTFVTAAVWADDFKTNLGTGIWHYIDIPFSLDGTSTAGVTEASWDVVRAMRDEINVLKSTTETQINKATSLRYIIHFAGDIHQPMHCSTNVTAARPTGDLGGNLFNLNGTYSNMHSLWDAGGGALPDSLSRPLSAASQTTINNKVTAFEATHPYVRVDPPEPIPNPMDWAEEGMALARDIGYQNITQNTTPSPTYLTSAQNVTKLRAAIAGQRLADLLNTIIPMGVPVTLSAFHAE